MNFKILIVDDDEDYRMLLVRYLERHDYKVQTACDLDSAVESAVNFKPHVVIVDFRFKDNTNGFDILEAMKKNGSCCRSIFVSGYASWELEERLEKAQVFRFLAKPFELDELLTAVCDATGDLKKQNACKKDEGNQP